MGMSWICGIRCRLDWWRILTADSCGYAYGAWSNIGGVAILDDGVDDGEKTERKHVLTDEKEATHHS